MNKKYLFSMQKKDFGTVVGCAIVEINDNEEVIAKKIILDTFKGKDLKQEIFTAWNWVKNIHENNKIWVSNSTKLNQSIGAIRDRLIYRIYNYTPNSFLNYTVRDLMDIFSDNSGREATAMELNFLINHHLEKIINYFIENPNEVYSVPLIEHLNMQYEHTGEKVSIHSLISDYKHYSMQ